MYGVNKNVIMFMLILYGFFSLPIWKMIWFLDSQISFIITDVLYMI